MTDNTFPTWDDNSLEALLHDAYDEMGPTPEAEERMLAAVMAATADAAPAGDNRSHRDAAGAPEPPARAAAAAGGESIDGGTTGEPAKKRVIAGGKIARIAASVAVVAVLVAGVGFGTGLLGSSNTADVSTAGPADKASQAQSAPADSGNMAREEASSLHADAAAGQANATASSADSIYDEYPLGGCDVGAIPPDTEEYDKLREGRFLSTATTPLSTVSADVDTASYCNVRRLIEQGASVPSGAVRIEEMLNYFDYGYATPEGDGQFATTVQLAPCPWNADTQLLVLGFATAEAPTHASAGSNLVFLIDVSGSMNAPDKLELLQDSFAVLTSQLTERDRVSIVTYASGEEVVLEGASGADAREIQRAIDKLRAHGATNGEAGLKMAYELAERNYIEGGVNRIVMASDGDLNVGITSESDLYDFVDAKRDTGIYLSVLGFGSGNYKDNKMETLADHGNGNYHYIDCLDEAKRVFGTKLLANLTPFADNVKVQVEFNPSQVKAYRLIGYENRGLAAEDFRDDAVDAGDVGPNSQFTVAYEIVPADSSFDAGTADLRYGTSAGAAPAGSIGDELLTCTLRWRAFADNQVHEQATHVTAADMTDAPSDDWKMAAAVIEFGMALRDSAYAGTSNLQTARELLGQIDLGDERAAFAQLVEKAQRNQ